MTRNAKLESVIQWGLLVILAVMPFHAFLSVWLGSLTHHEAIIQAWKEVLLAVLAVLALVLVIRSRRRRAALKAPWVLTAAAFTAMALVVTIFTRPPFTAVAFGIKTDLEFLLAGVIALIVATPKFARRVVITVLASASVAVGVDIMLIFLLPPDFLTHFGYGPSTILPFQHIAMGTNVLRFPGTLGGPNQLGTYLILPLCLSLIYAVKYRKRLLWLLLAGGIICLIATQSRGAWLGALLALWITAGFMLTVKLRRRFVLASAIIGMGLLLALPVAISRGGSLQYFLLHSSVAAHDQANLSDSQHATSLEHGTTATLAQPLGHGLGTAGPATFHAGNGNIIENYFLQVGFETGILGLLLFIATLVLLVKTLLSRTSAPLAIATGSAIAGICVVSIVLPAWADSSTALIVWISAGAAAGLRPGARNV